MSDGRHAAIFPVWKSAFSGALREVVLRFRFTLALLAVITTVGVLTGTVLRPEQSRILHTIGFDFDALRAGRWYVLPLAPLVQERAGLTWHLALQVALYVGALEFLAGPWVALAVFFASDLVATVGSALLFRGLAAAGSATAVSYLHTPDLGSSAGMLGALAAAAMLGPSRLRIPAATSLTLITTVTLLLIHREYPFEHALATAAGLLFGWAFGRRDGRARGTVQPGDALEEATAPDRRLHPMTTERHGST